MAATFWIEQVPGIKQVFGFFRGIWGKYGGKFTPHRSYYTPLQPKQILLDCSTGELMNVANNVPHLNIVIATGAELFSQMVIKHFDKDGKEIEDSPVLKLLRQPNPVMNQEQYTYYFYVMNFIYGKTFQYMLKGLSFGKAYENLPKALWILPSGLMEINTTGKMYHQTELKEIIKNFKLQDHPTPFEVDQMIYMAEGLGADPLDPASKIVALQIPLSNIVATLKSSNIILTERGMIGFISPEAAKDADGAIPLDPDEHERIRKEYQENHHLDSTTGHVGVYKHPVKWNPMTMDVRQLMMLEIMEDAFATIIAAARHDRDIYPSTKGATNENKTAGMKATIQNAMQPLADKFIRALQYQLIDPSTGEYLEACYDHHWAMQEDELKKQQAQKAKIDGLSALFRDTVIDMEGYRTELGVEATTIPNEPKTGAQANLRGLVGAVSGIAVINQLVATEFLDPKAAQNMIVALYGFDEATAAGMVTSIKAPAGATAPNVSVSSQPE